MSPLKVTENDVLRYARQSHNGHFHGTFNEFMSKRESWRAGQPVEVVAEISGLNLAGHNLEQLNFSGTVFSKGRLGKKTNLTESNLKRTIFPDSLDMSTINPEGAIVTDSTLDPNFMLRHIREHYTFINEDFRLPAISPNDFPTAPKLTEIEAAADNAEPLPVWTGEAVQGSGPLELESGTTRLALPEIASPSHFTVGLDGLRNPEEEALQELRKTALPRRTVERGGIEMPAHLASSDIENRIRAVEAELHSEESTTHRDRLNASRRSAAAEPDKGMGR